MSNYTVATNFGAKDALASGNPAKLILGAQFTTEFNNIATAIATKPDLTGAAFTGPVTIVPSSGVALALTGVSGSSPLTLTPAAATDYGAVILAAAGGNSAIQMQINAVVEGSVGIAGATGGLITGSAANDLCLRANNGKINFNGALSNAIHMQLDGSGQLNLCNGTAALVGPVYAGIPVNVQAGTTYTFVIGDANKCLSLTGASPKTVTIPANASVAFPVGTAISIVNNNGGGACTLNITTDTLLWAPSGASGSRTISVTGLATLLKVAATTWYISGSGVS